MVGQQESTENNFNWKIKYVKFYWNIPEEKKCVGSQVVV
jgi:hypothetical protein